MLKSMKSSAPEKDKSAAANAVEEIAPIAMPTLTQAEADTEMIPSLIEKVGATTIAEIDRLTAELQEAKSYLQSEGERIEQDTVRYTNLAEMALFTTKIIFDAVSQWHPASNQQNTSEVTAASTENNWCAQEKSSPQSV